MLRNTLMLIAVLFYSINAYAQDDKPAIRDTISLQAGIGTNGSANLALAYSAPLPWYSSLLVYEIAGGAFDVENKAFFAAGGVGMHVKADNGIYGRAITGIALNTSANDSRDLDGHIQFRTVAGAGYEGDLGRIGLFYQMLTNGGSLSDGYNTIGIEIGVGF